MAAVIDWPTQIVDYTELMFRAKKWVIVISAVLFLCSLTVYRPTCIYAIPLLIAGLFYHRSLIARWASLLLMLPVFALAGFQLYRRVYYAVAYGGEAPDGGGSPLAFLLGFAFETPIYILLLITGIAFYSDIPAAFKRAVHSTSTEVPDEKTGHEHR